MLCLSALCQLMNDDEVRDQVIYDEVIMESLDKVMGKDPSCGNVQLAMYTLLRYLGRSGQISKRIIKDGLSEIDFFERVGK